MGCFLPGGGERPLSFGRHTFISRTDYKLNPLVYPKSLYKQDTQFRMPLFCVLLRLALCGTHRR